MVPVRMVQTAVDKVVSMVAVRHGFMATSGTVLVSLAADIGRATHGVIVVYGNNVLVHVVAVGMLEVTVVQIINVIPMADGHMPAIRTVLMGGAGIGGGRHFALLYR